MSYTDYYSNVAITTDFTERAFDNVGKVFSSKVLASRNLLTLVDDNSLAAINAEAVWNVNKHYEIDFGAVYRTGHYNVDALIDGDTVRYDTDFDGNFDYYLKLPPANIFVDLEFFLNINFTLT